MIRTTGRVQRSAEPASVNPRLTSFIDNFLQHPLQAILSLALWVLQTTIQVDQPGTVWMSIPYTLVTS